MVDWLEKFAQSRINKKMNRMASQIIVDKDDVPNAKNEDIVEYDNEQYKVINNEFNDEDGEGVLLEKCATIEEANPMDVEVGTSEAYEKHENKAQEYANNDPQIQDPDPRDEEVAKFTEEAKQTEEEIAKEDSIDGTSGATRPNRILQKMFESGVFKDFESNTTELEDDTTELEDDTIDLDDYETTDEDSSELEDDIVDLNNYDFKDEDTFELEDDKDVSEESEELVEDAGIEELKNEFSKSNRIAKRM